jgi:hypothetical protein
MNNKTFSRGKVGSHQKTNRAAIGRALHKHNKKRFQWAAIGKDETASFEALKDEDQTVGEFVHPLEKPKPTTPQTKKKQAMSQNPFDEFINKEEK